MNALKAIAAAGVLAMTATAGNAAVYYADKFSDVKYGKCSASAKQCAADGRRNVENVKGEIDGNFYSLGLGGSMVLGFAKSLFPAGTVSTLEITFNRLVGHDEAVKILTLDANKNVVEELGVVTNPVAGSAKFASMPFTYIKLVDVTKSVFPKSNSFDGFDVDGVSVAPVPLPAAGVMLLAGLGGFAALRRRKNVAA